MTFDEATKKYKGRLIRIQGDHPWKGELATVIGFDKIGMLAKLIRGDAYNNHEIYVTSPKQYTELVERKVKG